MSFVEGKNILDEIGNERQEVKKQLRCCLPFPPPACVSLQCPRFEDYKMKQFEKTNLKYALQKPNLNTTKVKLGAWDSYEK